MSDERIIRIEDKLDRVIGEMSNIKVMLAADGEARKNLDDRVKHIEADLAPVKRHVTLIQGGMKFVGIVGVLLGGLHTVLGIIASLFKPHA
jgi:hypothetical protein